MAKCVFCGEKASIGKTVVVGSFEFKACAACSEKYQNSSDAEIVLAVKDVGIYKDVQGLDTWIEEKAEALKARTAEIRNWYSEHRSGTCPKCGADMLRMYNVDVVAYIGGLPTLNLSSINTNTMPLEMHVCGGCGYTEFYSEILKGRALELKSAEEQLAAIEQHAARQD